MLPKLSLYSTTANTFGLPLLRDGWEREIFCKIKWGGKTEAGVCEREPVLLPLQSQVCRPMRCFRRSFKRAALHWRSETRNDLENLSGEHDPGRREKGLTNSS